MGGVDQRLNLDQEWTRTLLSDHDAAASDAAIMLREE
jgi:hypothetical protein